MPRPGDDGDGQENAWPRHGNVVPVRVVATTNAKTIGDVNNNSNLNVFRTDKKLMKRKVSWTVAMTVCVGYYIYQTGEKQTVYKMGSYRESSNDNIIVTPLCNEVGR